MHKPLATYRGRDFRSALRQYGKDRCKRDPKYAQDVREALERRAFDKAMANVERRDGEGQ